MKTLFYFYLLTVSFLYAWEDPVPLSEETKLTYADWAGTGFLEKKVYVGEFDGEWVWKTTLVVADTFKGKSQERIEIFFNQGNSPGSRLQRVRCPAYPGVPDRSTVKVYLHKDVVDGKEVLFLHGKQMIEKLHQVPDTGSKLGGAGE